ncbi:hypothetical protein ACJ72_03759 [Emergomyces africanus]|uniref:Uncharacterized protein n=1 Tax=Emergomyces africanus TaxID=1955775 RepID=A0A1B7NYP2_9EURO|nr:hypothetical protein ACJ72_03759 [Emergomyces africanus]
MAHYSNRDPTETEKVITAGVSTAKGSQVGSVHIRKEGFKMFPNRLGTELGFNKVWRAAGLEVEDSEDRMARRAAEESAKASVDGDNAGESSPAK